MKPSPSALELQARVSEAWGERNARSLLANLARLSEWEAKRALILERDLPAGHVKRNGTLARTTPRPVTRGGLIPCASTIMAMVYDNGAVALQLHDARAQPFAAITLSGDAFSQLIDHVAARIEAIEAKQNAAASPARGLH